MPVVIFLVAAVILGGIVVVARGYGGELARNKVERPADLDLRNWSDVAGYRPPPALLGYHAASTEQALVTIARSIAERDAEIDWLRSRLAELQPESAGERGDVADAADAGAPAGNSKGRARADEDRATPDDDRAFADDDRVFADDDRAFADDDLTSTAPSRGNATDRESTPSHEGAAAREQTPAPEGTPTAAETEPPVQAGYWQQAGPAGRPSTHD